VYIVSSTPISYLQHWHTVLFLLLLSWHPPLGVRSAIRRHQPPQRAVLSQVDCFIQCEVVGSQISLDGVQPRDTGCCLQVKTV